MPDGDLRHLAEVEQSSIGVTWPDGSTGPTPVWVVLAGEAILVRSIPRPARRLVPAAACNPDGEVGDRAHTHPGARPPGRGRRHRGGGHRCRRGQGRRQPDVGPLLTEEAADATLRP